MSEGHHWPPPKGSFNDEGGSFQTTKSYVDGIYAKHYTLKVPQFVGQPQYFLYDGPIFGYFPNAPGKTTLDFPASIASSDAALVKQGTTAIARCEPTNSLADLSTFLGETYTDGLPLAPLTRTWKAEVDAAKAAGSEFLNVVFGWAPLVSDITSLSNAAVKAHATILQYERDSGKQVRRTYKFKSVKDTTSETLIASNTGGKIAGGAQTMWDLSGPTGYVTKKVETFRDQWFSGAFTYHLPSDFDSRNALGDAASEAQKILGQPLSPDTIWELTPWSWAIDWFSNAGDYIHNLHAFNSNGLVMRYGYMMEHTIVKHTYTLSDACLYGRGGRSRVPPLVLVTESKKRIHANPFGFGLTWSGLSSLQLSILAALGISRRS